MKIVLSRWIKANKAIFVNAGSLIGTWGVNSGLGFVYWWLAAHDFASQDVGIGSASISTMMLLGTICMMGLGTLLITELPRQPEQAGSLISTALIIVCAAGGCAGGVFALVAPEFSTSFSPLRASINTIILFALGVSLTSVTLVLDNAMIGLLQGGIQLWRNFLFALSKLVVLFLISRWLSQAAGMGIYGAWAMGNTISLGALVIFMVIKKGWRGKGYLPQWALMRKLGGVALQHHLLNLVLSAPTLLLPVMVTVMLSAQANAWFYIAWMVANFVFVVPGALTMVLHAVNSAQQATLKQRARVTLSLAFVISMAAICVIMFDAKLILNFFGSSYAAQASLPLQILALGGLPVIIESHYIAICRIHDRITQALSVMILGCLVQLGGAVLGGNMAGLVGLSLGWVGGLAIQSIFMVPTIYKAVFSKQPSEQQHTGAEPIWLMETALLPAMGGGYAGIEPFWLMNSALQPAIGQKHGEVKPVWFLETTLLPAVKLPAQQAINRRVKKVKLEALQSYSYQSMRDRLPTTDPWIEDGIMNKIHDDSTILKDEKQNAW
jgi:O-antigen/teichoic acid export membrane protein